MEVARSGLNIGMPDASATHAAYSQFTYGVKKMTEVATKSGLLTRGPRPPHQKPSHSIILTGVPTRTTAHWASAGSQRAATVSVISIEAFNPYVNWPLGLEVKRRLSVQRRRLCSSQRRRVSYGLRDARRV
eukprot:354321-Chlamydomonas_euryale.AAC.8